MKTVDFSKKIVLIYEKMYDLNIDKLLINFSSNEIKTSQQKADRKKTIRNWLSKQIDSPKQFNYTEYPFSELTYPNGNIFLTENEFRSMPFSIFKSNIKRYLAITYDALDINYNFIYYYNTKIQNIGFFKLNINSQINPNKYEITLLSEDLQPKYQLYKGSLERVENYIYINVQNDFERLNLNFMKNQGIEHSNQLYGISLGKAYETGVPKATKTILTIKELSSEQKKEARFYLNETEIIIADEAKERAFDKHTYIKKFNKKINELKNYVSVMRDILAPTIKNDIYLSLFHKEFISFNEISHKVFHTKKYYLNSRRRATKVFLQSISHKKNVYGVIVYPIFAKDSTLFNETNIESKKSLEFHIRYAKQGVKLYRIFVVEENHLITAYIKKTMIELQNSGIDIKIVFLKDIISQVSSYDFMFSSDHDVVLYREVQDKMCQYKVNKDIENIKVIMNDYEKIKNVSYELYDFLKNR